MAKNINFLPFDESTKLKLEIFGECFKEWLPVFTNNKFTDKIYVFDFFAGSGTDSENHPGSPLILLNTAKGDEGKYCKKISKEIQFVFNEAKKEKAVALSNNLEKYFCQCKNDNDCLDCVYEYKINSSKFEDIFNEYSTQNILKDKNIGKFILLDQYGFKEINKKIFLKLIDYPKTDFIFFISTSFINRFREHPNTKKYIETEKINFDIHQPKLIHRAIANYYRKLVPPNKEYYIHHFTIRQETNTGNYYGLIFGSNHTYGMEKFLKVCWNIDNFSGEANFNIRHDFEEGTMFFDPNSTNKIKEVKQNIKELILNGKIRDNITGMKYAMKNGCRPIIFTEIIKQFEKDGTIKRTGFLNYRSTNIHTAPKYFINFEI